MGVRSLWDILDSCKKTLPLHHLQNKRLCVDLSCWLVQLRSAARSPACVKEKLYLRNLFHRLRALIALNCSLIFVADGAIPAIKLSTYRRRLGSNPEVTQEEAGSQALRRNMGSEFSCMIKEAKVLGVALGIPCLDGVEEAEAQCALLNSASLCDGCFSSDSDILLFGARTVYRDIVLGESGYITCYELVDIEKKLGFGRNSLVSLAVLLGSDYSNGVQGFGPEKACRLVKSIGDHSVLHQIMSEGLMVTRRINERKESRKDLKTDRNEENVRPQTNDHGIGREQLSECHHLEVINAYLKPKCHSSDSEAVERVCTQHPFLRLQLQHLCDAYFGWSPQKTDQYILPKIAERGLRRFANLRSTTSSLGLETPLHEIPIPCPVSAIVKPRKIHGKEYYEVSWHNIEGLQVSAVPGDLIRSACPEKITEFMAKKGEEKKQKRRSRPTKPKNAAVSEVNLQLKGLLLGVESEHGALNDTTNFQQPNNVGPEVIDLSSPSPPLRARKIAKCQQSVNQNVDVIEVYESEHDVSPEHERKARELRLFINSIRSDLC